MNNGRGRVRSGMSDGVMAILRNVNVNGRTWSDVVGRGRSRTRVGMVYDTFTNSILVSDSKKYALKCYNNAIVFAGSHRNEIMELLPRQPKVVRINNAITPSHSPAVTATKSRNSSHDNPSRGINEDVPILEIPPLRPSAPESAPVRAPSWASSLLHHTYSINV